MIEDRRKYPRHPVLIRCTLVTPRDRRDAVCTQIGPASSFLTGRLEQLVAGEIVRVEMRSGGLGTPIITLLGLIVRVQLAGGGHPGGLAVRWRAAACELGPEPLAQFLVHVLRLPAAPSVDLNTDRHVQFDLEASLAGVPVQIVSPRADTLLRAGSEAVRASAARSATFAAVSRAASAESSSQRPVIAPRKEFGLLDDPGLRVTAATAPSQQFPAQASAQHAAPTQSIPQLLTNAAGQPRPVPAPSAAAQPQTASQLERTLAQPSAAFPSVVPDPRTSAATQIPAPLQGIAGHSPSAAASAPTPLHTALRPSRPAIAAAVVDQGPLAAAGTATAGGALGPSLSNTRRSSSALAVVLPPVDRVAKPRGERTPALGWRPPVIAARGPEEAPSQEPQRSSPEERHSAPVTGRNPLDRSALFDVAPEVSQAVGGPSDSSSNRERLITVSFPVYALAPAERRVDTNPDKELPRLATENFDMSGEPTEIGREVTVPVGEPPRPVANVADALRRRATSGNFDSQMMLHANFPVRFTVGSQLRSGHLVSLGAQAVAVITHEGAPELDQKVTVFLPVEMPEGPMVLDLRGKLLQVVTETDAGPRFVMHIEKVEEGHHKGAFHRLLRSLAGR